MKLREMITTIRVRPPEKRRRFISSMNWSANELSFYRNVSRNLRGMKDSYGTE